MNINISKNQLKWMGLALATVGVSTMNYVRRRAMEPMIIIGITGTIGAGKGTVVDYLKKHHRFAHFSARQFLYKLIDEKGLERNRDNLTSTANALRKKDGPAAVTINLFCNTYNRIKLRCKTKLKLSSVMVLMIQLMFWLIKNNTI